VLSRVAEAIYWMSRYIERAENVARFVDVNLNMVLDLPSGQQAQWEPLITTTGDHEIFAERYGPATRENVIRFLTFDREYPNSIISCLRNARECARSVREVISSEMWESVNRFYLMVNEAARDGQRVESLDGFFFEVKMSSHLFVGISMTTMLHAEGWHFSRLGRMLERSDKTSRILDVKYYYLLPTLSDIGTPVDDIQWAAVLRSASGLQAYRQRYHRLVPRDIAAFLILDRDFPRAIHHCVSRGEASLRKITGSGDASFSNPAEQRLGRLASDLAYTEIQSVLDRGLHEYLDDLQTRLNGVGDAIFETFFAMRPLAPEALPGNADSSRRSRQSQAN
jgi:uncharacterized alpha-E superfamily protein